MTLQDEWTSLPAPWQRCFELMWEAYSANTILVGAVLVNGRGEIVATGRNSVYERAETSQGGRLLSHAESYLLDALDPNQRYEDHTVYGSLEPCLLCVGRQCETFGPGQLASLVSFGLVVVTLPF